MKNTTVVTERGAIQPRLLIIIPAYNEEDSLGRVLRRVHAALPEADIVVVNDGSTDATGRLLKDTAQLS
jgi:glycosyltransferase involved in cell wall biosynthesis